MYGVFATALILGIQRLTGAWGADFGLYPDESGHYSTSLLIRALLSNGSLRDPVQFAERFYAHYPAIAIGHWPPFFYLVGASWAFLTGSTGREAFLILEAVLIGLLAGSTGYLVAQRVGRWAGWLAVATLLSVPLVWWLGSWVNADILVSVLVLWSSERFARFLDRGETTPLFQAAVLAALSVLTKGNGWLLCLALPLSILATRKWKLLADSRVWIAGVLFIVLVGPWQVLTLKVTAKAWEGEPGIAFFVAAIPSYLGALFRAVGLLPILLILPPRAPSERTGVTISDSLPAVFYCVIIATLLFHALVPAGIEPRMMAASLAPLAFLGTVRACTYATRFPRSPLVALGAVILLVAARGNSSKDHFTVPRTGARQAAAFINETDSRPFVLASASRLQDVSIVASLLEQHSGDTSATVVRTAKQLADVDWGGHHYRLTVSTQDEVESWLQKTPLTWIVLTDVNDGEPLPHHSLLSAAVRRSASWEKVSVFAGATGSSTVFRHVGPLPPASVVRLKVRQRNVDVVLNPTPSPTR
jgi:hypothetical protein